VRRRRSRRGPLSLFLSVLVIAGYAIAGGDFTFLGTGVSPAAAPVVSQPQARSQPAGGDFAGRATRIVDGDTFWIDSRDVSIRVWGLDAPEVRDPGGAAASAALTRLLDGQKLTCRTRDIDRFGRIVGQCFLPDGRDITAAMISSGTAREFCRFSRNHYGTC